MSPTPATTGSTVSIRRTSRAPLPPSAVPGPATGSLGPIGVTLDGAGNLYVADDFNNRIVQLAIPEPSSALLLAIGAGSLILRRRRSRA